jgi:microcystin-dependent protein
MFGGNFAPRGWATCDGQLLSISANQALFSILGTTYGGDGRSNFALPDLRGRVAINPGTGPGLSKYKQGPGGGAENVTLTGGNVGPHTHPVKATSSNANTPSPNNAHLATFTGGTAYATGVTDDVTMDADTIGANTGGTPVDIVQPWAGVLFVIALQGTFPSRN